MDKLYIQMCREAEEIRESWEPKSGDLYLGIWRYREKPKMIPPYEVDNTVIKWDKSRYEFCFWVPRQEDLQDICRSYFPDALSMKLNFLNRDFSFEDLNQDWLVFTMELVYGKIWNGNTWEEI